VKVNAVRRIRRIRRGLAAPGAILLAGLLFAAQGCAGSSASARAVSTVSPALTMSDARQAFSTFAAADDVARASGNEWLEASLVSYGQVGLATAAYQDADFLGQRVPRYQYGNPRFYVPRLKGYPLWFMAAVPRTPRGGGPTSTAIMVFDKQNSTEDFTLASLTLLGQGSALPQISVDSQGYAKPLATFDPDVIVAPDSIGAVQATIAQDGPHASATKVVAPGPYTTGAHAQIINATKQAHGQGYNYQALLGGSGDPVFPLQTSGGGALAVYTLNLSSVTLRSNPPVRQIEIPSPYAPLLNGRLVLQNELDTTDTDQYAAEIPPKAPNGKPQTPARVIAFNGGPTGASGH
jgi:hypothetical protein